MDSAFGYLRDDDHDRTPDSRVARSAVLEGTALKAVFRLARGDSPEQGRARALALELVELVGTLDLPTEIIETLTEEMRPILERHDEEARRARVLAYLSEPQERTGPLAHELAQTFDEDEREVS